MKLHILEEDVEKHVRELIVQRKMEHSENYANAREVRNLFEEIITNQVVCQTKCRDTRAGHFVLTGTK
jgi:hypothetical protein